MPLKAYKGLIGKGRKSAKKGTQTKRSKGRKPRRKKK